MEFYYYVGEKKLILQISFVSKRQAFNFMLHKTLFLSGSRKKARQELQKIQQNSIEDSPVGIF